MNTSARAVALAEACRPFAFLGPTTADDLTGLVIAELGSIDALEHDVLAPRTILHILAGNTPAAALQTLVRGLLLGSHNFAKLPSSGLPEVGEFIARLPGELAKLVETGTTLPEAWIAQADAVIVFGGDDTIAHFRRLVRDGQRFIAHGHKVSFGVIFDDPAFASVEAAARDVAAFDQLGCLSPHALYIGGDPRAYAEQLAAALERVPRDALPLSAASAIHALREDFAFRAANGEPCAVWSGANSTVIYDETPSFPQTPLHRTIFVKPLPVDFARELADVHVHLSCAGIFPDSAENISALASLGLNRICAIGQMQLPPWTWHQDGVAPLASLVRPVDR